MKNIAFVSLDDITLDLLESMSSDFPELSSTALKFPKPEDGDIDTRCCTFLEDQFATLSNIDAFFIDISLSETILDFSGIRLAYHIRLLMDNDFSTAPIILFGETNLSLITQFNPLYQIIFTKGVYLCHLDHEAFKPVLELTHDGKLHGGNNPHDFAAQTVVPRPSNHRTHHSSANEWSIVQWGIALGIDLDILPAYQTVKSELYYRYLEALNPTSQSNSGPLGPQAISGEGRILLIDDEYQKGWKAIFDKLFQVGENSKTSLEAMVIRKEGKEEEFKTQLQGNIINACVDKIRNGNYDLVIIDLRLCDQDFESTIEDAPKLTGIQIIQKIREWNRGQQIIAFTASNKIWNFRELSEWGVRSIHKHSPEVESKNDHIRATISDAIGAIEKCLNAKEKKNIHEIKQKIQDIFKDPNLPSSYFSGNEQIHALDFFTQVSDDLEAAFEMLLSDNENGNRLALILSFRALEGVVNTFIFSEKGKSCGYWKSNKKNLEQSFAILKRIKQIDPKILTIDFKTHEEAKQLGLLDDYLTVPEIKNKIANLIRTFAGANADLLKNSDDFADRRHYFTHPNPKDTPTLQELQSYFHLIHEIAQGIQSYT